MVDLTEEEGAAARAAVKPVALDHGRDRLGHAAPTR